MKSSIRNKRKKKNFSEMISLDCSLFKPQLISETTWSYFNEIKEPFCVSFELFHFNPVLYGNHDKISKIIWSYSTKLPTPNL